MLKINKCYAGIVFFLGVLSLFPLAPPASFHLDEAKSPLFQNFPMQIGPWLGQEAPVDERTYEILETRNVLSRMYKNDKGDSVYLLLVGSYKDRRVAHPPEVCYMSSNFIILDETQSSIEMSGRVIPVKSFTAKNEKHPDQQERVTYLYKVGDRLTTSYYAQQIQFALDRLSRRETQVLLIRLAGSNERVFPDFLKRVLEFL